MSPLFGRTVKGKDERLCPGCQKKNSRCSVRYGGAICTRCDGQGNFKLRSGNTKPCFNCVGGSTKDQCHCHKQDKWYYFDKDLLERPPLKPSSPRATDAFVDLIYTAFLDRCYLTADWRKHLQEERNLSNETIEQVGFVTLPPREKCDEFAAEIAAELRPPVGVPGFYEDEGVWHFRRTLHWRDSGLVIPYRNSKGQIVMLQVRTNSDDPKRRYMCLSGAPHWVSHTGTGSGAPAHWMPNNNEPVIGVTEGGLKAIRIAELWPRFGKFPVRWVGLCGLTVPSEFFNQVREFMPDAKNLLFAFDREVEGAPAWDSVERVKKLLVAGAAKWGIKVCPEPKFWAKDGARKFDDYLGGLV